MADHALEIRGLDHTFHTGSPDEMRALQGIDLTLERGAFVIVGPRRAATLEVISFRHSLSLFT